MRNEILNNGKFCRACGYDLGENPWGESGIDPDFTICACCGCEAGYEDVTPESARSYREKWIAEGSPWFRPKLKPQNWDLRRQLANIKV